VAAIRSSLLVRERELLGRDELESFYGCNNARLVEGQTKIEIHFDLNPPTSLSTFTANFVKSKSTFESSPASLSSASSDKSGSNRRKLAGD
jgi:hypothetical protein